MVLRVCTTGEVNGEMTGDCCCKAASGEPGATLLLLFIYLLLFKKKKQGNQTPSLPLEEAYTYHGIYIKKKDLDKNNENTLFFSGKNGKMAKIKILT